MKYIIFILLVGCEVDTDVRRTCTDYGPTDEAADKRAAFIVDCLKAWNPGEEEWAAKNGERCEQMAWSNWPPATGCARWHVEVYSGVYSGASKNVWASCAVQSDPDVIARCKRFGWRPDDAGTK